MSGYIFKVLLTSFLVALSSEMAKFSAFWGAAVIALPMTSLITIVFLYLETNDPTRIANFSLSVFWLVLPTLGFFLVLPLFLKNGLNFWLAILLASAVGTIGFFLLRATLKFLGIDHLND